MPERARRPREKTWSNLIRTTSQTPFGTRLFKDTRIQDCLLFSIAYLFLFVVVHFLKLDSQKLDLLFVEAISRYGDSAPMDPTWTFPSFFECQSIDFGWRVFFGNWENFGDFLRSKLKWSWTIWKLISVFLVESVRQSKQDQLINTEQTSTRTLAAAAVWTRKQDSWDFSWTCPVGPIKQTFKSWRKKQKSFDCKWIDSLS